ncbi:Cp2 antigen [Cryptosporidium xiaoi]|uniref:Cp2 antigen n=1 Tax=Cryptosporidium xiaoi TaxID=659607 RepID=A0AAV9XV63_9CRYT
MKTLYFFLFSLLGTVLSQNNLKHTYSFISPCTAKLDYVLSVGDSFSRSDIILYGECTDKTTFTLLALSSGTVTGVALPDGDKDSDILVGSGDPIYTLSANLGFSFLYRTHSKKSSSGFIGINVLKYEPSHVDGKLVITPLLKHTSADCIYPTVPPSKDQVFCEFHESLLRLGTNVELSANDKFNLFIDYEKKHSSRDRSAVSKTCSNSFHPDPRMSERQLAFIFSCIFFPHDSTEAAVPMAMSVRSQKASRPVATAAIAESVESTSEDDGDDDGSCGSSCKKNKKDKSPKVKSTSEDDDENGSCGSCGSCKKDKSSKVESTSEDDDEDGSCGSCKNKKDKSPKVESTSEDDDENGSCGSCKKNKKDKSSKVESTSEDDDENGSCGSLKMTMKMVHAEVHLRTRRINHQK